MGKREVTMNMKRKCRNCNELLKGCNPEKNPLCELRTMMIEQLVAPHKINALAETLDRLGLVFRQIGVSDFVIEMQ